MPRRAALVSALLIVVALAGCSAKPAEAKGLRGTGVLPPAASGWPAAQYDARHSSGTPAVGPQHGHVRWTAHLGGDLTPGTVLGTDGSVLQASNDGVLHALDPATGRSRWTFRGGAPYGSDLSTSPLVLRGGTILWPGPGNTLFALSATGHPLWRLGFAGQVLSPAAAGRNRVYVADMTGRLVALVVRGSAHRTAWTLELHGLDYASPAVGPDGTITTATERHLIAVTDAGDHGVVRWTFPTKRQIEVSNGVAPDGTVVLGTNHDLEYGIRPDGTKAWGIDLGDYTYSSSTVRPDGAAVFADNSGRVRVVDVRNGRVRTLLQPQKEHAWTSVVSDSRGDLYWASMTGHLYGYTSQGRRLFQLELPAGSDSYPALGSDGTLYVGTTGGALVAVGG